MDAVIFICICLFFVVKELQTADTNETVIENIQKEDTARVAKLNESFYEDTDAFMDIAHALGFPAGDTR